MDAPWKSLPAFSDTDELVFARVEVYRLISQVLVIVLVKVEDLETGKHTVERTSTSFHVADDLPARDQVVLALQEVIDGV